VFANTYFAKPANKPIDISRQNRTKLNQRYVKDIDFSFSVHALLLLPPGNQLSVVLVYSV